LLNNAREHRGKIDQLWDEALASARETISQWSSLIREKALHAFDELRSEDTLRWNIPPSAEIKKTPYNTDSVLVCAVTVVCLFSKEEPLALSRSGIRYGIYGDLDLSRAIGEPKIEPSLVNDDDKHEFVKWTERDDGRIGRIELAVCIANNQAWLREEGRMPVPEMIVSADSIEYDDYHKNFEYRSRKHKRFGDPMEAFEVFLALVVENAKVPQYDARYVSDGKIHDRGKFELGLLEDC